MKLIIVVLLSLCVGANHGMLTKMPSELQRVLAEAGRNVTTLESFRRLIHVNKSDSTSVRLLVDKLQFASTKPVVGKCPSSVKPIRCPVKVANLCIDDSMCPSELKCCDTGCRLDCVRPLGRSFRKQSLVGESVDIQRVFLDNELCSPRPVVVEVPQPVNEAAIYFPFHVMLNRCGGACNARPLVTKCEPQEQIELNVMVFRVAWTSSTDRLSDVASDLVGVRLKNHTKCGCECVTKPTDCDNRTQHYSSENCRCECKPQQVRCPFNHRWDPIKCECRCNPTNKAMCGKRQEFDDKRCACVCSSKSCRHNKVRDLTDCRCKCLHRKCSAGMIYDKRTCTCRGNI